MIVYKIFIPQSRRHSAEMQKWCKENEIQHLPTQKAFSNGVAGWIFSFKNEQDAMAFKLKWT